MRTIIFTAFTGLLCFCTSCNDRTTVAGEATENSQPQKNLEACHVVNRAFETGDVSGIDSVVASDFVDHSEMGDTGRDSLKAMITKMHTNMKDMKMEIKKELADSEYVFSWMNFTGTSDGSMGMPKGPYNMNTIEIERFKDGKIAEHWGYVDMREMMKMMGQMQGGNNMGWPDSSKMKTDSMKIKK